MQFSPISGLVLFFLKQIFDDLIEIDLIEKLKSENFMILIEDLI